MAWATPMVGYEVLILNFTGRRLAKSPKTTKIPPFMLFLHILYKHTVY